MADSWACDISETNSRRLNFSDGCPIDARKFEEDIFYDPAQEALIDQETTQSRPPNRKRKQPDSRDPAEARDSKLRLVLLSEGNPVCQLHESGLKISFEFVGSQGPPHQPSFTFSAVVNDVPYNATGSSKKQAKENAARQALDALREQMGLRGTLERNLATSTTVLEDSNIDNPVGNPTSSVKLAEFLQLDAPVEGVNEVRIVNAFRSPSVATSSATLVELSEAFSGIPTNGWSKLLEFMHSALSTNDPCSLAERIAGWLKVRSEVTECSPACPLPDTFSRAAAGHFAFMFVFARETFYAISHQKKSAKHNVGAQVLNWFLDIAPIVWKSIQIPRSLATPLIGNLGDETVRAQKFASKICIKVYEKLNEIEASHTGTNFIRHIDHNHLAAVCVFKDGKVIPVVLATGSSIIYRKNLSSRGRNLKDCQAEILALRGVKRYLLGQVASFIARQDSIFLEVSADGKLRLKEDVGFHLFLTRTPSGSCSSQEVLKTQESASLTAAPSAMDCFHYLDSEIASAVSSNFAEKAENCFHEITEGHEKLKIMSSSDKLLKKMVVGIQGSLVSAFAHPIFLQTVCMRGNDELEKLASGLYGRLLPRIPSSFQEADEFPLVCPEICGTLVLEGLDEKSLKQNPSLKAFLWVHGNVGLSDTEEFIETSTGLTTSGRSSDVGKRSFATLFRTLTSAASVHKASWMAALTMSMQNVSTYADLKNLAVSYRTKVKFFEEISRNLGHWIAKCPEEENFSVIDAAPSCGKE